MNDSGIYFDMARLNKKAGKERREEEIMDELFGVNATCTSIEFELSQCGKK